MGRRSVSWSPWRMSKIKEKKDVWLRIYVAVHDLFG